MAIDNSPTKHLQLESIPLVDLRLLSQSELNSLSLISTSNNESSSFDRYSSDDIVIPKIDRSVFNESAGSRKQTYNRLHFAPTPTSNLGLGGRNRRGFFSISKNPNKNGKSPNFFDDDDHERKENKRIVALLRELFAKESGEDMVVYEAVSVENGGCVNVNDEEEEKVEEGEERERKRKRGRKRKDPNLIKNGNVGKLLLHDDDVDVVVDDSKAIVLQGNGENRNGEVVDIVALANMDDPFGPELERRSMGLVTDNELLGFLGGLEGKWASTRKKRKIVDAADFGDHLPNGWKILLGLKRKGGQVWLHCRRYISPSGQQFESMKEVSSYLHSIFGTKDTNQPNTHSSADICGVNSLVSESVAGLPHRDEKTREGYSCHQASLHTPLFTEHENQVTPVRIENLPEVEVKDLLVCRKCNTSYSDKDAYMQHLLTIHQSKSKNRLCSSISDGVIMNDGKYECQFCHKIFQEKHRYNGHVGNHVKNYVRRLETSSGKIIVPKRIQPSSSSAAPSALKNSTNPNDEFNVEAPQSKPVTETSKAKLNNDKINVEVPCSTPAMDSVSATSNAKSNYDEMNIEAFQSKPGTDSVPETFNAKLNDDKMSIEAPCSTPAMDSVSATSNAKSPDEMNVEAPRCIIPVTNSVVETSNANLNNDELIVEAPLTSVVDSVSEAFSGKSGNDEMNVEAPQCIIPVTKSVVETSNANLNNDEMTVEAPLRTPVADSVPGAFSAKSDYNEMNVEAPQCIIPVTNSAVETSYANLNNDGMNVEAPLSTVVDPVLGTFNAKTNLYEMSIDVLHCTPAINSSTSKPNDRSPHCKLDDSSIPETSTPKYNWELNLASPYGNQDRGADKMKESLADESCDKQYSVYEIPDKLGEIHDEPSNNLFGTFNPCLYSASILSSDQGDVTSKTSNGEYVFGSTSDEIGKYGLGQEAGSESCWLTLSTGQQIKEIATSVNKGFSLYPKDSQLCEAQESGNNVPESCFVMRNSGHVKNVVPETIESSTNEGNLLLETMVADTSMGLMKSSNFFPTFNMISDKGENDFRTVNQRTEKVSDFDDLKLDDIDTSKFNFLIGQESNSLQEEQSMGLSYDADLQQHGLGTSYQFDWDSIIPNMESRQQQQQQLITTVCVWCGMEFNLDTLEPALVESDSVGYMCPSCKAKISGQQYI